MKERKSLTEKRTVRKNKIKYRGIFVSGVRGLVIPE